MSVGLIAIGFGALAEVVPSLFNQLVQIPHSLIPCSCQKGALEFRKATVGVFAELVKEPRGIHPAFLSI